MNIGRRDQRSLKTSAMGACGLLALLAGLTPTVASAQDQGTTAAPTGDIVVTAQKREQRLIDVPGAVSVIGGQQLLDRGADRLQDYLAHVPGVSLDDLGDGRTQIVIRGVTTGQGTNPTVGITIDDAPFGSTTFAGLGDSIRPNLDPFDLQQIEVLRGPQGTLYGASTLGGLIKFETIDPSTTGQSGRIESDVSSTASGGISYGERAAVNLPITSDLAIRASGFYRHDGGYINDVQQNRSNVNDGESYGGRLAAKWTPTDTLTIKAAALLQNLTSDATSTVDIYLNGSSAYGRLDHSRLPGTDGYGSKIRFYDLNASLDLGWSQLTSISSYSQNRYFEATDETQSYGQFVPDFYPVNGGVVLDNTVHTNKFTQEVRLSSPANSSSKLNWIVGLFYTHEKSLISQPFYVTDPVTGQPLAVEQFLSDIAPSSFDEYAAFANVTYHINSKLEIEGGVRESHNRQHYTETADGPLNGGLTFTDNRSHETPTTYLATLRYKPTRDLTAYFRFSTGYRPGGPNAVSGTDAPQTYHSDSTYNYELGIKGDILQHRLSFELVGYHIDWNNIQLRTVDNEGFSYFANGGQAKVDGAEASSSFKITPTTTIGGNLTYTNARITQNLPAGSYGLAGSQLPFTAHWNGSVDLEQTIPINNDVSAVFSATGSYVGKRLGSFNSRITRPRFDLEHYTTVDLRAGLLWGSWNANLYVNNLANTRGYLSATQLNVITYQGAYAVGITRPRTVGLTLAKKF